MAKQGPRTIRFSEAEAARLERLATALYTSEPEALRWALIALERTLQEGRPGATRVDEFGASEAISLSDPERRRVLTLTRGTNGFQLASEARYGNEGPWDRGEGDD